MDRERQKRAPIYEALEAFKKKRVVPFDVPGHKRGRGNPELVQLLGEKCVSLDVNSMKPLDNLCHPISVIREAEGYRHTTPVLWVDQLSPTEVTFETQNTIYHLRVVAVLKREEACRA